MTGLAISVSPASAATTDRRGEAEVARCVKQAAGGKLWLERTLWGLRDQEAGWIGAEVLNSNGTHDLGPLQINSWWVPRIAHMLDRPPGHVRYWLRYDPCFNAQAARWIFLSALRTTGDFWKAVGVYHSPTAWRQRRYTASVVGKLRLRFGEDVFAASISKQ
ncbi:lytic transglycosylase domain-containing protein [Sphingobium chungbukense]|uniref:Murein transglycosylase n=1 Tax=Sphingobium chungbukense TaxID=56193 RepID=A0A0M3AVU5_9SPHN|nr:lytic transglycosylase domain-containing protein [Sphingobium chungbukense]KKW93031.1 murein transglycosylase [Sphingobium chungbukense]